MKKKSKFYINEIIFSEDTYLKLEYSCESNVLDSLPKTISLTDNHSWDRLISSSVQNVLVGMWTTAKKWYLWSPDYENFLSGKSWGRRGEVGSRERPRRMHVTIICLAANISTLWICALIHLCTSMASKNILPAILEKEQS